MEVKTIDRKLFESVIDGLARAIKEKPEDIIWFFQVKQVIEEMEKPMKGEDAWEIILRDKETSDLETADLLEFARDKLAKFHRIEKS